MQNQRAKGDCGYYLKYLPQLMLWAHREILYIIMLAEINEVPVSKAKFE